MNFDTFSLRCCDLQEVLIFQYLLDSMYLLSLLLLLVLVLQVFQVLSLFLEWVEISFSIFLSSYLSNLRSLSHQTLKMLILNAVGGFLKNMYETAKWKLAHVRGKN